jgi:hypothetical protein
MLEKKWKYNETMHQLVMDLKKAYDLVRREVLYSIFIEFGVPMKLLGLIKMFLNEMYSKVCIGKHLSDNFPVQNGLKQRDSLCYCFSTLLYNMPLGRSVKTSWE